MPINTNTGNTEHKLPPFEDGESYFARVVQVVDLGLQSGGEYQGEKKPDKEQILLTFEFGEVRNEENRPAWLSVFLSLPDRWEDGNFKGMHVKSNIYKYLNLLIPEELWRKDAATNYVNFGYTFTWDKVLGKPIQLTVAVNDEGRAKIKEAAKVSKKFLDTVPKLENTPVVIDMESATIAQWKEIYPWVRKLIGNSLDETIRNRVVELDEKLKSVGDAPAQAPKAIPKKVNKKSEKEDTPFNDDIPF
jgi:hypothetical protein